MTQIHEGKKDRDIDLETQVLGDVFTVPLPGQLKEHKTAYTKILCPFGFSDFI